MLHTLMSTPTEKYRHHYKNDRIFKIPSRGKRIPSRARYHRGKSKVCFGKLQVWQYFKKYRHSQHDCTSQNSRRYTEYCHSFRNTVTSDSTFSSQKKSNAVTFFKVPSQVTVSYFSMVSCKLQSKYRHEWQHFGRNVTAKNYRHEPQGNISLA